MHRGAMHTKRAPRRRLSSAWLAISVVTAANLIAPSNDVRAHPIHLPSAGMQIVVDGVDNPRSLAFDAQGDLYVAAAGRGGTKAFTVTEQGLFGSGLTGKLLRVKGSDLARVPLGPVRAQSIATGLVSMAYPDGSMAHGVHGVAVDDQGDVFGLFMSPELIGAGSSEACCQESVRGSLRDAALAQLGNLMRVDANGALTAIADVDHYEYSHNPVGHPGSNPYAVTIDRDGTFLVADAGANTILRVGRDGSVGLVAAIDNIRPGDENTGVESVPTGIAVGPDGSYYVSLLAGFHPGFARIVKISADGAMRIVADGLSMLTGIAVASDGTVYASEFSNGDVVRVRPEPGRADRWLAPEFIGRGELLTPTAVALGPDGWLYVSDGGAFAGDRAIGNGRIVRLRI